MNKTETEPVKWVQNNDHLNSFWGEPESDLENTALSNYGCGEKLPAALLKFIRGGGLIYDFRAVIFPESDYLHNKRHYYYPCKLMANILDAGQYGLDMLTTSPILSILAFHPAFKPKGRKRLKAELQQGIKAGRSAKELHKLAEIPWPYRRASVKAARKLIPLLAKLPQTIVNDHAPKDPKQLHHWCVYAEKVYNLRHGSVDIHARNPGYYSNKIPSDLAEWFLKNWNSDLNSRDNIHNAKNIVDWWRAALPSRYPAGSGARRDADRVQSAIDRKWNNKMTVKSALEEHDLWVDRLNLVTSTYERFPAPWYQTIDLGGDYSLSPIRTSRELLEEGRKMRHCVSSYAPAVMGGGCYIYSLRKGRERALTVELRHGGPAWKRVQMALGLRNRKPNVLEREVLRDLNDYLSLNPTFL